MKTKNKILDKYIDYLNNRRTRKYKKRELKIESDGYGHFWIKMPDIEINKDK